MQVRRELYKISLILVFFLLNTHTYTHCLKIEIMNINEEASSSNIGPEFRTQNIASLAKPKTPVRHQSNRSTQYVLNDNESIKNDGRLEGVLLKHTNVMKGYQNRYFVVNEERGTLEYYVDKKSNHLRGALSLVDCNIAPSEDDSQTFIVSNSDVVYKLKASTPKERHRWVDKLRQVALNMEKCETKNTHLNDVRESLLMSQKNQIKLINAIESFSNLDRELLILKSTSYSSVMALENCFAVLQELK